MSELEGAGAAACCPPGARVPWVRGGEAAGSGEGCGPADPGGAARVPVSAGLAAVYARVSSADQRSDLDRQVARVTAWAAGEGLAAGRVVTAAGSRARIDRASRVHSRTEPGSASRRKSAARLARIHARVRSVRRRAAQRHY